MTMSIPVISIRPLVNLRSGAVTESDAAVRACAEEIDRACKQHGFFYIADHGVSADLEARLETVARSFFSKPTSEKMLIAMAHGGRAWRGYFQVGNELTSNSPDWKEGIYFGSELANDHDLVQKKTPMHGPNLFPVDMPELRTAVLQWMDEVTQVGHALMCGLGMALGIGARYFETNYTSDPLILFRIFNYPAPLSDKERSLWGVGEHTDYGVLTILKQDLSGGLEVKTPGGWISAPPIEGTFVCNINDMLDRMTGGLYKSTPHRVRNVGKNDRISFPLFFDPNFFAEVGPIAGLAKPKVDDAADRWDKSSVHLFQGTYGDYLLGKVAKVFPELKKNVLD